MSVHLRVYEKVLSIYKNNYKASSKEFRKGFEECLRVLHFSTIKEPSFNMQRKMLELEREIRDKDKLIASLTSKLRAPITEIAKKSLISSIPLKEFKYYELKSEESKQSIILVTNLDRETLLACWYSFSTMCVYDSAESAKAKFLNYINHNTKRGFRAFKDVKTAVKEGVKIYGF